MPDLHVLGIADLALEGAGDRLASTTAN